jgi:hypothetical protein
MCYCSLCSNSPISRHKYGVPAYGIVIRLSFSYRCTLIVITRTTHFSNHKKQGETEVGKNYRLCKKKKREEITKIGQKHSGISWFGHDLTPFPILVTLNCSTAQPASMSDACPTFSFFITIWWQTRSMTRSLLLLLVGVL